MRKLTSILLLSAMLAAGAGVALAQEGKVQTTTDANQESLTGAAKSPLRDLNVLHTEVPDVLVQAMSDPYARPQSKRCTELIALVLQLNQALGTDLDQPPSAEEKSMMERGRPVALGAVAGAASDIIPFRGVVRSITGAARHDAYVQAAITAGFTRRGYLKGLGEARGCQPPATPSHVLAGRVAAPPPSLKERLTTPLYPVR